MDRLHRLAGAMAALAVFWAGPALAAAAGPFSDWAAVVVAGDWRANSGGPTEAFDNARRDVALALVKAGFAPANIRQFSVRPQRYRKPQPLKSDPKAVYDALTGLARTAEGGCLVYLTSHGTPQGVVIADRILPPPILADMVDQACGARPTVVIVSACFSGVFVPELARANRMVLTAARPDRTSFGCGEADRYPYFDDCFLRAAPAAANFAVLGTAVQACVAAREAQTGVQPPSEPQLWIGPQLRPMLPLYAFANAPPGD